MKALSIRQPWAYAILFLGKDIENRTWRTHYRGRIAIHAGKKIDVDGIRFIENELGLSVPEDLPTGCLVGTARLEDVVTTSESKWFQGPYGLQLIDPCPYQEPIPCRGALSLFRVNAPYR